MRARVGDVVEVTWYDAWADHETSTRFDWKDECLVVTRGSLERLTPVVTVAGERIAYGSDESFRCVTHVPVGMVKSIDVLRRPS